jgi:hypothetical protein
LGTPNLYMILYGDLTAASCVIFTTGTASIHLVNVSVATNKNMNPPGALSKVPIMSIPKIVKGQDRSIG